MLRLDDSAETIAEFHRLDPRWKRSGRGRLMRSPTFFEDVIKTVTSCNVTWPSTVTMNRRLCEVVGRGGAFPAPKKLARTRCATLRARCRVGYRDARILELASMFASGEIEPEWFEDPATPDEALWDRLLALPGIGPYAAANIMQLLGRYHRLPLDSESIRHGKAVLGLKGTDRAIMQAMHKHFAPFGRHAFRSYWFELWRFYERKAGPSWTWEKRRVASSFTASQLK
jgi:3-methyladenine DNA glycosylase/8-oxoguanine DNA glycosylase